MTEVIFNPITRQAVVRTVTGLAKLGIFAAVSIMAGKTFNEAGNQFLVGIISSYRQVKDIVA